MKLSAVLALLASFSSVAAFVPPKHAPSSSALEVSKAEILKSPDTTEMGKIWDPLGLSELGSDETLAWFRHSEIKHGRIAMAAFVGWWAVGSGLRLPGDLAYGLPFASIPSKGLEAWDAVPGWGKAQLLLFAGLIEFHDELFYSRRGTHYMKGGVPGKVNMAKYIQRIVLRNTVSALDSNLEYSSLMVNRTWFQVFTTLLDLARTRVKNSLPEAVTPKSRMAALL